MPGKKLSEEQLSRIYELAAQGLNRDDIARQLGISTGSVSYHLAKSMNSLARVPTEKIQQACSQLTTILESLKKFEPQEENPTEEEKGMSDEETTAKVERLLQERKEKEQQGKDITEIKSGIKELCQRLPELCEGQKLLGGKVDGFVRIPSEPKHLWIGPKETKHTELADLLTCCDSDDPKSCNTPNLCASIPPTLQAKMLRHFCKNDACIKELEAQGFRLDGEGYREQGKGSSFLGG